ncbi:uncharacterized protein [Diadema antillarum]|uniref:uncharacterized protein n=1 Tax=Diadema antillarum TaxID=105358 RepID=UPI003A8A4034
MTHCTHRGSLMENNIEMIPVDFFSGTNIQYLGLSMNQIGTFPSDSLRRMTSLIFLSLDDNKLTSVSRRNLASLSESPLQHLNLSNNEISYLAPRGFSKLTHLKILELHQNSISAIQPGVFDGISNILHMYLQDNVIQEIEGKIFGGSCDMDEINLTNNNIETIGTDSSIRHLNVTSFDISGNPLVCTCGVFYTMYEIQSAIVGGECEGPSSLVGTHFVRKKSGSPLYFLNRDEKLFQCTPLDFEASAPAYQTILAKWSSPDTPYPIFDDNLALNTYVNWTYTYTVTCNSDKGFVATGNTTELFLLLGPDDGVKEDTLYTCSATLTFNGNTSVAGNSASVLTLAEPNSVNGSVDRESNITLPITYYDFRFWEASFFPLDDVGYGSQSQRDCVFQLHNLGFTSAIRTAIRFNGNEELAVGGGEEIWVFLNKVLVVELHRGYQFSTNCKKITLRQDHIGTYFAIREGDVIAGECHVNSDQSDVQYLDLVIGEKYRLDIFHTERQSCASDFLLELRGFSLLGDDDRADVYNVVVSEDLSVNSSLATITVGDVFSTSTLSVSIISGNEARHFTFENSTGPTVGAGNFTGIAQDGPTYEVNGIVFSTCPTDPVLNQEPNVTGIQEFIITSVFADLVLDVAVDYEVATEYFLVIFVEDDFQVPTRTGSIKIQILVEDSNDNCPILHGNDSYRFFPLPVLSREPLAVVRATDADVGVNSQLTFTTATLSSMPMDNSSFYMVEIIVAAIDGGTPSLGDVVLVNLTISETCIFDILGESIESSIYINETTGELHLRVPKYYLFEYDCRDPRGMENGIIRDGMITASSVLRDDYSPDKARLYSAATERGPIGSGWVPAVSDTNQWIQVDMGEVTIFSGLQTQGSLDDDHWVETYQVAYSNDTSSWTYVQEKCGDQNFTANSNKNGMKLNMFEEVYARYIRIYPKTWNIEIGLRFEILGCTTERRFRHLSQCERCETTNYCIGDGLQRPCGRCDSPQVDCPRSPTEHSFGHASECSECPIGWLCVDGYATHCPTYTYVTCNTTYCPDECTTCEAGTACFDGQRFPCGPGTFSRGYDTESCKPCAPGSYNNESLQSECTCCDSGFSSTEGKTECTPCQPSEFSLGDCSVCQPCLSEADCPCLSLPGPCTEGVTCVNTGGTGGYRCLDCPKGFTGTGDNCRDINECSEANPCYVNTSCVNLEPGFECGSCPPGFNGKVPHGIGLEYARSHVQVCTDINECAIDNGGCDVHAICENTIGSFTCTTVCEAGYIIGDDGRGCTPGDYCFLDLDDCHGNASCTTTGEGTFQCECDGGFAGNGVVCELDDDADGRPAATLACDLDNFDGCQGDNCPTFPNSGQEDVDGDGFGDACDEDDDSDRIKDAKDNCQFVWNPDQRDSDGDGFGDLCDFCPSNISRQIDTDGDGVGDDCDDDDDDDGIPDQADNCPLVNSTYQTDRDGDGVGDLCDNCPDHANPDQGDSDQNGYGDSCDNVGQPNLDMDGDGILDISDNCLIIPNADQTDTDGDGTGDQCDDDKDGDGIQNGLDNCPLYANPSQEDTNDDGIGDECETDYDGDGTSDIYDICPKSNRYYTTTFDPYNSVNLEFIDSQPSWDITDSGKEVQLSQLSSTPSPVMLIGRDTVGPVDFRCTTFVNGDEGGSYIGLVFGYQSNRKFYVAMWRHSNLNRNKYVAGIRGLQIKRVHSSTGPGSTLANALWHSYTTNDEVELIWHDPLMQGWQHRTAYLWQLTFRPSIGLIRLVVQSKGRILTDTGDLFDSTFLGGHLGVFVYDQPNVIFSNLQYKCADRRNMALKFDGVDDYVTLPSIQLLGINGSYTLEAWCFLEENYPSTPLPIFAAADDSILVVIQDGYLQGKYGSFNITTTTSPLIGGSWAHVAVRLDVQDSTLSLFVNGTKEATLSNIETYTWVRIWGLPLFDDEIREHMALPSLEWQKHKNLLDGHYTMDEEESGSRMLVDSSPYGNHGRIYGDSTFVASTLDAGRFQVTYPDARRRKKRRKRDVREEL